MPALARILDATAGVPVACLRLARVAAWCVGVSAALAAAAAGRVPAPAAAPPAPHLVVVNSGDSRMYGEGLAGIREAAGTTVEAVTVGRDDGRIAALVGLRDPNVAIIALGNRASEAIGALAVGRPVVQCMVTTDASMAFPAAERVSLVVPAQTQATWLRRLLPQARSVALLYTPRVTEGYATKIAAELAAQGYSAKIEPVASPSDLPVALHRIAHADALLALPDPGIYSPELARGILLFSYRTRTPLVGYTQPWVQAGALYGFEWRYAEVGAYCATLALARLAPAPTTGALAVAATAPVPRVFVNRGVATRLGIGWDPDATRGTEDAR
ncbi:MAG: hypothetical protein JSR18_13840 [Proteobacteria bacterium]|nr:hypothetical protein [Pseudomonadota bacterium]